MVSSDISISIIDRLIQLATIRERNRERYFNNFIEPLYRDAERIAHDYMALLTELSHRIRRAKDRQEIIEWLELRRAEVQPVRMKVRALLTGGFTTKCRGRDGRSLSLFMKGLWGLIKGGLSAVNDKHALTSEYGFGDHTVLDLLQRLSYRFGPQMDPSFRERLLAQTQHQREAIERAWGDVASAYAEMRTKYLR